MRVVLEKMMEEVEEVVVEEEEDSTVGSRETAEVGRKVGRREVDGEVEVEVGQKKVE